MLDGGGTLDDGGGRGQVCVEVRLERRGDLRVGQIGKRGRIRRPGGAPWSLLTLRRRGSA